MGDFFLKSFWISKFKNWILGAKLSIHLLITEPTKNGRNGNQQGIILSPKASFPTMMDLSVIIVNYNGLTHLRTCLDSLPKSLLATPSWECHVVDNASTDGSQDWLKGMSGSHAWLTLHLSDINAGFAAGNNVALKVAKGKMALLLNSDAYLIDDSINLGLKFLTDNPNYFAVAGTLLQHNGELGVSYGRFPTPLILLQELFGKGFNTLRAIIPPKSEPERDVDFPCGAYFLMNMNQARQLNFLDESFFLFFEETDLSLRANKMGWKTRYIPNCKAVHIGGGSSGGGNNGFTLSLFYESWKVYSKKHHGNLGFIVLAGIIAIYLVPRWCASVLFKKKLRKHWQTQIVAMSKGFFSKHPPSLIAKIRSLKKNENDSKTNFGIT